MSQGRSKGAVWRSENDSTGSCRAVTEAGVCFGTDQAGAALQVATCLSNLDALMLLIENWLMDFRAFSVTRLVQPFRYADHDVSLAN